MPPGQPWKPELAQEYTEKIRRSLKALSLPTTSEELGQEMGSPASTTRKRIRALGLQSEVNAAYERNGAARAMPPGEFTSRPDYSEPVVEIVGATATVEPDVERIRKHAEERFAAKARRSEQKKHQKVYFQHGPVALFVVSDQHFGSEGCNVARAFAEQEMIMNTPGAYVIQAGDLIDNMIIGKLLAEGMRTSITVWDQWQLGQAYLAGFGNRLIAVNSGNHTQWSTRLTGVDYDREITPDGVLYDADEVNFDVHVGHKRVKLRMRHRWRGRSQYSASHALEKAARFEDNGPDIFIGGHVHEGATAREFVLGGKRKLALMASTYKEIDSYQREQGFVENDASTAVACVISDSGAFWGTSDLRAVMEFQRAVYRK